MVVFPLMEKNLFTKDTHSLQHPLTFIILMMMMIDHSDYCDLQHDQVDEIDNGDNEAHEKETLQLPES